MKDLKSGLKNNWINILEDQFNCNYYMKLEQFLKKEYTEKIIYPEIKDVFNAFNSVDFEAVKVVILGQDPYHKPNQAHGLAFSVKDGTTAPPSLINIYKELNKEFNYYPDGNIPKNGNLQKWANQGVLLLNACLTVEKGKANSHKNKGWEKFTDNVISKLNNQEKPICFILWGNNAKEKIKLITNSNHLILTSPHPSPLSAHRGFFGCNHFIKANEFLLSNKNIPIDWKIDD